MNNKKDNISIKLIDGGSKSFADVICDNKFAGDTVLVTTFGVSLKQIEKLLFSFEDVTIIIDESQSKLNPNMIERIIAKQKAVEKLHIKMASIHAKLAIIDNNFLIVSSANLTSNYKIESYLFIPTECVGGITDIVEFLNKIPCDSIRFDRIDHKKNRESINEKIIDGWGWL
jgi:hypothetical protein